MTDQVDAEAIAVDTLRALLDYNPSTGVFVWKMRERHWFSNSTQQFRWNGRRAGKPALIVKCAKGRMRGNILGHRVMAHRVAWAIHYGDWPMGEIDHINGDAGDNRIANLRVVDRRANCKNIAARPGRHGLVGIGFDKRRDRWTACIGVNGRTKRIGRYVTLEEAQEARRRAEVQFGYHPNHARRARGD